MGANTAERVSSLTYKALLSYELQQMFLNNDRVASCSKVYTDSLARAVGISGCHNKQGRRSALVALHLEEV